MQITLGAMCPSIAEQLAEQGLEQTGRSVDLLDRLANLLGCFLWFFNGTRRVDWLLLACSRRDLDFPMTACAAVEPIVRHSRDLDFTIVAVPHEHYVDFTVYDIEGWAKDETSGAFDIPLWHRAGAVSYPGAVDTLDEAEPYLHGVVKWDGCSNWHFDEQDRVMLHGCSRRDMLRLGEVMALCWDWTADLCPAWDT